MAEKEKQYQRQYYQEHKERYREYGRYYRNTKLGMARQRIWAHNKEDEKFNRGKGDLTPEWMVENILSKPCKYCGETDWHKIGCNRIDDTKPHTRDNVEPCCNRCNIMKHLIDNHPNRRAIVQLDTNYNLINRYKSIREASEKTNYCITAINNCINDKYPTSKGNNVYKDYIWMEEKKYNQMMEKNKIPIQLMLNFN